MSAGGLIGQLGRFGLVGVFNTLVDIALFWLLTVPAGVPPLIANLVSFSTGALCSFVLNGRLTFRASGNMKGRAVRFVLTTLIVLAASTAALAAFLLVVPAMVAKLLSVGVSFVIGFLLQRLWVFRPAA